MKDRTGTTLCPGCRTYRVDAWFVNVKGKQCRSCAICRGITQFPTRNSIDGITAVVLTGNHYVGNERDAEDLKQKSLVELAKAQQKYAAKAERKTARKAAERQKLTPPATDDKEVAA